MQSERRRNLALAAGHMGSWDWDLVNGDCMWDEGQHRIFGVEPDSFRVTLDSVRALIEPEDWDRLQSTLTAFAAGEQAYQTEFRVVRPDGERRWCIGTASATVDEHGRMVRVSGVTVDITDRKRAEEHQILLAREVDHRAKNALAVVQSIVRLSRSDTLPTYVSLVEGRIRALARAHTLLAQSRWQGADLRHLVNEEMAPYRHSEADKIAIVGPDVSLEPRTAQTIALALHELATNAVKYGALAQPAGRLRLTWSLAEDAQATKAVIDWREQGVRMPEAGAPKRRGYGTELIERALAYQLKSNTGLSFTPDGVHCVIEVPIRMREEEAAHG
jgi:PAS domain S-box-containing protein